VQVSALKDLSLIPDSAKRAIDVFLQEPEGLEVSAPEAYGYEFQSHGVVEMLEKLLDELIAERTKLKKEEQSCLATPGEHRRDLEVFAQMPGPSGLAQCRRAHSVWLPSASTWALARESYTWAPSR